MDNEFKFAFTLPSEHTCQMNKIVHLEAFHEYEMQHTEATDFTFD